MNHLLAVWGAFFLLGASSATAADRPPANRSFVDLHVDLSYQSRYKGQPFAEGKGRFPAASLLAAGVRAVVLPLYIPNDVSPTGPRMQDLDASYQAIASALAATPPYQSPGCALRPGKVTVLLSFEGAAPLAGHPEQVKRWIDRGVRSFGLVHNQDNALATSSAGGKRRRSYGLTPAGEELVAEVFRHGAVVDVSHASDKATRDVLELARRDHGVVVATHSNAWRLANHVRNLRDPLLRGIADTGGVIGVNFHSRFLTGTARTASLADVVKHIRYIAELVGVAHVGIGSDYEGGIRPPPELRHVRGLPKLRRALRESGFSVREVESIFGQNALRALCGPPVPSVQARSSAR